ncbi:unnamed protein product, partial [Ixodes pacificus]
MRIGSCTSLIAWLGVVAVVRAEELKVTVLPTHAKTVPSNASLDVPAVAEVPKSSTVPPTTIVLSTTGRPSPSTTTTAAVSTATMTTNVPVETTAKPGANATSGANATKETSLLYQGGTVGGSPTPLLQNLSAPCSRRLGTLMERTLRHFPARLPELWEFRRRRFLRAAVVGGLPQIVVEKQEVSCNISSAVTSWDVELRSQLDGICNLGITGLPRMYLRFTGPVTARAKFSAPFGDDSKPQLEELQILTADVHEIHYQSVLGFEQPFVERASKYLLQRALREEVIGPLREAINAEIENPTTSKNKVLVLEDFKPVKK